MSEHQSSPQRPSAAVYRRRRLVVLVFLVLVVALLIWLGSWAVGAVSNFLAGPTQEPIDEVTTASPEASEAGACELEDISVVASTAAETFSVTDTEALLELEVTNTSEQACTANVGTSVQEFLITSGSDRIFSSKDCQVDPVDHPMVLEPGKKELARFGWQLNRSLPDCAQINTKPQPGTYKLTVTLGELESEPRTFYLR